MNGDVVAASLALSLSEFVTKATGLSGVTSLGSELELPERGSALPVIFSSLGVFFSLHNTSLSDNWTYEAANTQMCASALETRYQAIRLLVLDSFLVRGTSLLQTAYLSFFLMSDVTPNPLSPILTDLSPAAAPSCSVFFFNLAEHQASLALSSVALSNQSFQAARSQGVLLSFLPFDYTLF